MLRKHGRFFVNGYKLLPVIIDVECCHTCYYYDRFCSHHRLLLPAGSGCRR